MLWKEIALQLMNEQDSILYVAGKDDYQLQYMNARAKDFFGLNADDESYLGQKCYELFFDRDKPCDFCKNPILNKDSFCHWDNYNEDLNEHFYHRSKLICLEGKNYHFEIADIFTDRIQKQLQIEHQLETEQTLLRCIKTLSSEIEADEAINSLLEIVTEYYDGDRCYLFEINWEDETLSNTYESVAHNATKEINNLQNLPVSVIKHWLYMFREKGIFYISSVDQHIDQDSDEYKILRSQNIHSLIAAPLIRDGIITGFIGVDNPRKDHWDFTLLSSVTHFVQNDLEKRKFTEKLEKLSYEDSLTGLYNRNKYNHICEELKVNPPNCLGIIYLDLNGLKQVNDTQGHEEGDRLLKKAASTIRSLFRNDAYRIGGDEFIIILPGIPKQVFEERIVKLRQKMADHQVQTSIGSCWRDKNINLAEQVRFADSKMYADKEAFYKKRNEP